MVTPELIEYIKNERARGVGDNALRQALQTAGGWSLTDIEMALGPDPRTSASTPAQPAAPQSTSTHLSQLDLRAWRLRRRHFIFVILAILALALYLTMYIGQGSEAGEFGIALLAVFAVEYVVSMLVAKFSNPAKNDWLAILVSVILAAILTVLISGGLCTAFFMIVLSTAF